MENNWVVLKIGSQAITTDAGEVDLEMVVKLCDQISELHEANYRVALVSSGAVSAGKSIGNMSHPSLAEQQVFSSIGQPKLMKAYEIALEEYDLIPGQVLSEKQNFQNEKNKENLEHYFEAVNQDIFQNIVPIFNENDVMATRELRFTDNDELAKDLAIFLKAEKLIYLTDAPAVCLNYQQRDQAYIRAIKGLEATKEETEKILERQKAENKNNKGRGGIESKILNGVCAAQNGITTHIVNAREERVVSRTMNGENVGTTIYSKSHLTEMESMAV